MIITRGGRKRPYKAGRSGLTKEMAFPLIPQSSLTDRPIILEGDIEGYHVRRIYVYGGSSSEIIVGEKQNYATGVRNSKVSLTLPHDNGKDEHKKPRGCREQAILRNRNMVDQSLENRPMVDGETEEHAVTTVPRFVMEHQLKAYPLAKPIAHRKRPLTSDRRQVLNERVPNWLMEGIIRRVQYPGWVTNAVLIKQRSGVWQDDGKGVGRPESMEEGKFLGYIVTDKGIRADPDKVQAIMRSPTPSGGRSVDDLPTARKRDDKLCVNYGKGGGTNTCLLCKPTITRNGNMLHSKGKNYARNDLHCKVRKDDFSEAQSQAELRTYDISYIPRKEVEGQAVRNFPKQERQTPRASEENDKEASEKLQKEQAATLRAWRLYLGREASKEALLAGLVAFAGKGMKDLHVFVSSKELVDQDLQQSSWSSSIKRYRWASRQDHRWKLKARARGGAQQEKQQFKSQAPVGKIRVEATECTGSNETYLNIM
ncbi:hypothetical protein Tco_1065903 [Tanacetum coccineum]